MARQPVYGLNAQTRDQLLKLLGRWKPPIPSHVVPGSQQRPIEPYYWAKITGGEVVEGVYRHSWSEVQRTATTFEDHPEPQTGTKELWWAQAPYGQPIATNSNVLLIPSPFPVAFTPSTPGAEETEVIAFTAMVDANVTVKITGNEAGGGKYAGVLVLPKSADIIATGDLAAAETAATSGQVCRVLNYAEQGKSTHDLTANKIYSGTIIKRNSDGVIVVAIFALETEDCEETP